jgi:hypothetical protein
MTVRLDGDVIHFEGHCRVEDAETLVALLQTSEDVGLDLATCESLHAAVVQTILAFGRPVVGQPADGFIASLLTPALARAAKATL